MKINFYHRKALELIQQRLQTGSRVLDYGCGSGAMSLLLAGADYRIVGVDRRIHPEMKEVTEGYPEVSYVLSDLSRDSSPFVSNSFGAVVALEVLEHLADPWAFIRRASELLQDEGLFVLSIPNYWSLRYRTRYLLTGNIQQPLRHSPEADTQFISGSLPHVNTLTWPVLKYALEVNGLIPLLTPFPEKMYPFKRIILFFPLLGLIKLIQGIGGLHRRLKYQMKQTNSLLILLGGPHIFVLARKRC